MSDIKLTRSKKEITFDEIKIDRSLLIEPIDASYLPPSLKAHKFFELLDKADASFSYISAESKKDIDVDELILDDDGFIIGNKNISEYLSKMKPLKECEDFLKIHPVGVYDLMEIMDIYNKAYISKRAQLAALFKFKNDPKQLALDEIFNHYEAQRHQFKRRGYTAQFVRDMHAKYPIIESQKTIENLVSALNKENEDIPR